MSSRNFLKPVALLAAALAPLSGASLPSDDVINLSNTASQEQPASTTWLRIFIAALERLLDQIAAHSATAAIAAMLVTRPIHRTPAAISLRYFDRRHCNRS